MVRWREVLEGVTAFLATAVAGLLLVVPLSFGRTCRCTPYQVNRLVLSVPREAAIGVLVAAVTAVVAVSLARARTAWWIALAATSLLFVADTVEAHSASPDILTTTAYLDAIGSGVLLGATGVAVLGRRVPATGLVLGAVGCFVVITLSQASGLLGNPHRATTEPRVWSVFETQPWWLLAAVAGLILACQVATRHRFTPEPIYPELPLSPVVAAIVLVMTELGVAEWRFRHGDGSIGLIVTAVCTLLATTVAAWLLPRRDGIAIYLAVGLSATGSAVGNGPRPAWSVPLLLGLILLGYLAGTRIQPSNPLVGAGLLAAVALFASVAPAGGMRNTVTAALAVASGYCAAGIQPRTAGSILAIAILWRPSTVAPVRTESFDWTMVSPHHLHDWGPVTVVSGSEWAAFAITVGCGAGLVIRALPKLRTPFRSQLATWPASTTDLTPRINA
ncbi:hypothetical protein [Nocardia implantans]|uniref:Integral membrane protein n=1 Tax=Nocardia implantans TaxID=3108168 RepID=A0ABU6B450_9NOCA|nr:MULTISPECIES: hypothetical protein [unclassified Nocardia]MBF6196304.1 hypothetical protein [Nocardia beijingensis]MEA3527731.1 hypothetical protein [Nocardia sp. CDC192]MEB3514563.1 hypothetical protein [Nocardia sp. CDC186]